MTTIWIGFVGLGLIGLVLSVFRWWMSFPIIILLALWAWVLLDDFYAPDLYPVFMRSDSTFIPVATAAMVIGVVLPFVGIGLNVVRRSRK